MDERTTGNVTGTIICAPPLHPEFPSGVYVSLSAPKRDYGVASLFFPGNGTARARHRIYAVRWTRLDFGNEHPSKGRADGCIADHEATPYSPGVYARTTKKGAGGTRYSRADDSP